VAIGRRAAPAPRREDFFYSVSCKACSARHRGAALQAQKLPQFREHGIRFFFHKLLQTLGLRAATWVACANPSDVGSLGRFAPPLFKSPGPGLADVVPNATLTASQSCSCE